MSRAEYINVIGAGLAGSEAAWQAARLGVPVRLYEMKPEKRTPAHSYSGFAELVCSNSLRSLQLSNAIGLLKEELRRLGSLIMEAADANTVPAGAALAVDRYAFSDYITDKIKSHPLIEVIPCEVTEIPEGITVVASGPLTSDALAETIHGMLGEGYLSFFDAAAPIVDFASVDMTKAYFASRYGKGEASYINCPMEKDEYDRFYEALVTAEEAHIKDFDKKELKVFEGCMPVEVMAKRGRDTLLYGPLKPVGLPYPGTDREPYAVVQLRAENAAGTMYNLVGFQTHLTFGEQKRVFGMIPGLENAEFLRYGVMHRNTYLNSPKLLSADYSLMKSPDIFFAGQMTGVEGYIESTSSGWLAGVNAARRALGLEPAVPEKKTVIGALAGYVSDRTVTNFQPMNANFGIVDPLGYRVKGGKTAKNEALAKRALDCIDTFAASLAVNPAE
ncbi:MAG: methylenetetrahydrofolate--tRNA-(uracil(54)-C(5))-methyltransferase (FADH(2)-oxidizing) TrmFO [Firmicutes bacterium]|uniref:Methylenetetrahydrofolate--tRNA-(uracil-5-)-methyltransferase TrmFO n=1 Tax=Candidatus Colimorpha enterica TaxID=3083063 RepID=A0AAE3K468_9BACT|nr:methylenetetrahydrofolate--tRNA-(uracil(54)-C(5))-methyltransferase (FADH(2)-oxidizing) TrmFO [Candidatus Colimorpha enterica]